jgi:hypothetical protein
MAGSGEGKRSQGAEPLRNRVTVTQSVDSQLFVLNFPTILCHVVVVGTVMFIITITIVVAIVTITAAARSKALVFNALES